MEVMSTVYAKSGIQSQQVSNYTRDKQSWKAHEYCEKKVHIICEQHFSIPLNQLKVVKATLFSISVGTHFRIFVCEFLVHLRMVYACPQKLAWPLVGVVRWNKSLQWCLWSNAVSFGTRGIVKCTEQSQQFSQGWGNFVSPLVKFFSIENIAICNWNPWFNNRAVYTRVNKLRITQSISRELSHLYGHSLSKEFVCSLRKPRTCFLCRLYEQFAAYISRRLCNPRLIFPHINGPSVVNFPTSMHWFWNNFSWTYPHPGANNPLSPCIPRHTALVI